MGYKLRIEMIHARDQVREACAFCLQVDNYLYYMVKQGDDVWKYCSIDCVYGDVESDFIIDERRLL